MVEIELSYNEKKLLLALDAMGGKGSPEEAIAEGGFSYEVEVMGAASWLQTKGLAEIKETSEKSYALTDPEASAKGLPERHALAAIDEAGGSMSLDALSEALPGEDKIAVGWLMRKRLARMEGEDGAKCISLNDNGKAALSETMPDEELISRMLESPVPEAEADRKVVKDLRGRKGMIKEIVETQREITLTSEGVGIARSGLILKEETADVTDELVQSGKWKDAEYRRYDVNTFAPAVHAAKKNPLTRLGNEVKRMFTEMGFSEMSSEYVQPCFWNMDVLFIPQDHPARDMQDTFYLEHPETLALEDEKLVEQIKAIQENGGETGSTGWGGEWSEEKAAKAILRTHSTVSSIRYIADHPDAPQKAFSISRIFRKESIDATHLPEFSQIEGIVIDENANLDMLISLIREFYARMGFDEIHVRPAYFPYTEPSLELEVFFNGKWMELGGAGIFRPEVVAPFGVKSPVLAWGFGFERLAMLKWDIKDIRDLYISDIDSLKKSRVLRSPESETFPAGLYRLNQITIRTVQRRSGRSGCEVQGIHRPLAIILCVKDTRLGLVYLRKAGCIKGIRTASGRFIHRVPCAVEIPSGKQSGGLGRRRKRQIGILTCPTGFRSRFEIPPLSDVGLGYGYRSTVVSRTFQLCTVSAKSVVFPGRGRGQGGDPRDLDLIITRAYGVKIVEEFLVCEAGHPLPPHADDIPGLLKFLRRDVVVHGLLGVGVLVSFRRPKVPASDVTLLRRFQVGFRDRRRYIHQPLPCAGHDTSFRRGEVLPHEGLTEDASYPEGVCVGLRHGFPFVFGFA